MYSLRKSTICIVTVLELAVLVMQLEKTMATICYSCAGTCHASMGQACNCQIGFCEAEGGFCFIEKKPTELSGVERITKGCMKRPSRTRVGCDYDHFADHIQCVCHGDFCNDAIAMRSIPRRNITCRECSDRQPDCSRTCQGHWCHEKVSGASGCGYGPPSLPYFYKGPALLHLRGKTCVTVSRGTSRPHKYCICNSNLCNDFTRSNSPAFLSGYSHKSRSVTSLRRHELAHELHECVNCDLTAEENALTSSCKQNRCVGHYCIYATQRLYVGSAGSGSRAAGPAHAIIHEKQGCINVTDISQVQLGCTHKWMNNEEEELFCTCKGRLCNEDLSTINASAGIVRWTIVIQWLCAITALLVPFKLSSLS
ncbi:hypothetical protein DdX_04754 [Ditylenchus destructor]|uniref:Uncharacterized protein n=1 Tax=Ditylenchus destructor TaxID=166010 RepID=A0AAD4R720_9BILA|nr:hypothetical protein DdX_04754 [Ditylenchus destructor]